MKTKYLIKYVPNPLDLYVSEINRNEGLITDVHCSYNKAEALTFNSATAAEMVINKFYFPKNWQIEESK